MTEAIIVHAILILANFICVILMYKKKNYKIAILNGFAVGFCFMGLLNLIK